MMAPPTWLHSPRLQACRISPVVRRLLLLQLFLQAIQSEGIAPDSINQLQAGLPNGGHGLHGGYMVGEAGQCTAKRTLT